MQWWMWVACGLGLAALEVLTPGSFVFVFMAVAALAVGAGTALGVLPAFWEQSAAAALLAGASLVLFRRRLLGLFTPRRGEAAVDTLLGQSCTATAAMPPQGRGTVEFRGASWSALNVGASALAPGARCAIVGSDGLTLRLVAAEENKT